MQVFDEADKNHQARSDQSGKEEHRQRFHCEVQQDIHDGNCNCMVRDCNCMVRRCENVRLAAMLRIPLRLWILVAFSGALQVLPFPVAGPAPAWRTAFCWIALVPLLAALLAKDKTGRPLSVLQAALLGYVSGIVWYCGNCYWIYQTMYLYGGLSKPVSMGILFLFCLYLGLYHALFGALAGLLRRSPLGKSGVLVAAPFLWVAVELARARITSFPWDQLGVSQVDNRLLTMLAPYAGVYAISFLIVVVNVLFVAAIRLQPQSRRLLLTAACALLGAALQSGRLLSPAPLPSSATAFLLQDNLQVGAERAGDQMDQLHMLSRFTQLSEHPSGAVYHGMPSADQQPIVPAAGPRRPDLIVWPEAPTDFRLDDPAYLRWMSELAQNSHASLIIAGMAVEFDRALPRGYRLYNSAAFFAPNGTYSGRYDKMHLVPFGEYIPFKDFLFFAKNLTQQAGDMDHGTHRVNFTSAGHSYGTFICYESIFADEVRQFVRNGAQVLVNVSDDGWYGDTSAPWQHLNMARLRAIENHRWLLRSTNTGVTASIDPYGRVIVSAPRHVRTAISVRFGYESDLTFYTLHGDLFAYLCALVTLLFMAFAMVDRKSLA